MRPFALIGAAEARGHCSTTMSCRAYCSRALPPLPPLSPINLPKTWRKPGLTCRILTVASIFTYPSDANAHELLPLNRDAYRTTRKRPPFRAWRGAAVSISTGTASTSSSWGPRKVRSTSAPRRTAGSISRRTRGTTWPSTRSGSMPAVQQVAPAGRRGC